MAWSPNRAFWWRNIVGSTDNHVGVVHSPYGHLIRTGRSLQFLPPPRPLSLLPPLPRLAVGKRALYFKVSMLPEVNSCTAMRTWPQLSPTKTAAAKAAAFLVCVCAKAVVWLSFQTLKAVKAAGSCFCEKNERNKEKGEFAHTIHSIAEWECMCSGCCYLESGVVAKMLRKLINEEGFQVHPWKRELSSYFYCLFLTFIHKV